MRQPQPAPPPPLDQPYPEAGGLQLPRDVGIAESTAAAVEQRWSATIERVNARLHAQGFYDVAQPQLQCPEVSTEALLSTDLRSYTVTYAGQLQWYRYTVVLLAKTRAALLGVENEMSDIAAKKRIEFRKQNQTAAKADKLGTQEMADLIDQDPIYNDLKLQEQELTQYKLQIQVRAETLEESLKVVSRQIENRKMETGAGGREQNMPYGNRPPGGPPQQQQPNTGWRPHG